MNFLCVRSPEMEGVQPSRACIATLYSIISISAVTVPISIPMVNSLCPLASSPVGEGRETTVAAAGFALRTKSLERGLSSPAPTEGSC